MSIVSASRSTPLRIDSPTTRDQQPREKRMQDICTIIQLDALRSGHCTHPLPPLAQVIESTLRTSAEIAIR
jgi:hypothetical protein